MLRPWPSFRLSEDAGKERLSRGLEMRKIICAKPDPGECMATTLKTTPPCVAIDAAMLIALCAGEPDKIGLRRVRLRRRRLCRAHRQRALARRDHHSG